MQRRPCDIQILELCACVEGKRIPGYDQSSTAQMAAAKCPEHGSCRQSGQSFKPVKRCRHRGRDTFRNGTIVKIFSSRDPKIVDTGEH